MMPFFSAGARALLIQDDDARRAAALAPLNMETAVDLVMNARTLRDLDGELRARRVSGMPAMDAKRFVPSTGAPISLNRASRTVEVIWSTGVRSRNFVQPYGWIMEELDMAPSAVRMDVLRSGRAPVLDTHRRDGAAHVLGRVVAARIEGGRGYATLQFSTATDVEPVWQRVVDGTLRSISAGYRVHRYDQRREGAGSETIYRAVDWEPYEISMVPVPIDYEAMVR
jgi:phage head maturation protease